MNELDLIRSFRADMPVASAAATASAERAWLRPKRRSRLVTPLRAGAVVAVAAAAAAAAVLLPSGEHARLGAQPASAAEVLRHAAAAQVGGVDRPLRPGEYWYVRRLTTWANNEGVREDWVGIDGRRRFRMRNLGDPGSPRDYRDGPTKLPPFYDGVNHVTYAQLLDLPREPEALYQRMRRSAVECECGNGVDEETFVIASDLLRDNPIPADLRAAIMRATALIPGIELLDDQRDVAGRPGVGVAYDAPGPRRKVMIFDPRTYELLGEKEGDGGSADLESAIVSSIDERP